MMKQSLCSKERLSDAINLNLLEKYLNQLYDYIKVPLTLFNVDGEIISYSPCTELCKEIICKDPRMEILCKNSCSRFGDYGTNLFFCPNGLMKYRIPLQIKDETVAYLVLRQFMTEREEINSIKNMLIKRGFEVDRIKTISNDIPILNPKKFEKIKVFINELVLTQNDMSKVCMNEKEQEERAQKNYNKLITSFEDIDNEKKSVSLDHSEIKRNS